MKRCIYIFSFVFLIGAMFLVYFSYVQNINKTTNEEIDESVFSIMLQVSGDNYLESDISTFPDKSYIYNSEKSYCINESVLTWDNDNRLMNLDTSGSDKCYVYFDIKEPDEVVFSYTGSYQEFIVPADGKYKIELWGAQGGNTLALSYLGYGGYGAYTIGTVELTADSVIYIYVGGKGIDGNNTNGGWVPVGAYNGGGKGSSSDQRSSGGGGATDVRLEINSLNSRIMVAGGGGGGGISNRGSAGGMNDGLSKASLYGYNATVTSGGSFGVGGTHSTTVTSGTFGVGGSAAIAICGGGGGGYYGGGGGTHVTPTSSGGGGGGSSYISGHLGGVSVISDVDSSPKTGCLYTTSDVSCSYHYSDYIFFNTTMIDGNGFVRTNVKGEQVQMPNPSGELYGLGTGHIGNGYARITGPL